MGKLLIVDGNAILHRAYHAIPPLTTTNGEPINAVHGMVSMLLRIVDGLKPTHIAFAFDRSEPTFRKKEYAAYQSQRPETDDALSSQFEKAREVLRVMNIPFYDKAGYEADDIIGTLAHRATSSPMLNAKLQITNESKKKHHTPHTIRQSPIDEVVIVTGDKDQLQLVNKKVSVFMPVSGVTTGKLFSEKEVVEKMGVSPSQIVDYKALVGDPSDNYPGVFGIGPKTAINLLNKYGTFPKIYENIKKISGNISEKLIKGEDGGRVSYKLAQIVKDVNFDFDFKDMDKWNMVSEGVVKLFRKYGFRTLTARVMNYDLGFKNKDTADVKYKKNLQKDEVENIILEVAEKLKGKRYAIRGTASMVLQGLDMGVNDIDIICDKKTALSINTLFKKELIQKVEYSESDKFKSYFGKAIINDALVEFYGEWQINKQVASSKEQGAWGEKYDASEDETTEIEIESREGEKTKVKVTKLELELKTSVEMGRWNEFHKIKRELDKLVQPTLL